MRIAFLLFILLLSNTLIAQDTIYFDNEWNKLESEISMSYYKVFTKDVSDTNQVAVQDYLKTGQILKDQFYISYSSHKLHGKQKSWFRSGEIKSDIDYDHGKKSGQLFTYWENGQIKRSDVYNRGRLKKGECWDQNGLLIKHFDYAVKAEFPGGIRKFYQYLDDNLGYPLHSAQEKIEGKVIVRFTVEKDGSITKVHVFKGINEELNWEAIRLVKFMPKWTPAKLDGEYVDVKFSLPISFRLSH